MRRLTTVLAALAVSTSIFGCAGPPTGSGVPLAHHFHYDLEAMKPPTGAIPALVLSGDHNLLLFNSRNQQIGAIPVHGGEGEVAMDKQGDIYYDSYNEYSGRVLIFAPPYTEKPKVISFANKGNSRGVTVDWRTGIIAVATVG